MQELDELLSSDGGDIVEEQPCSAEISSDATVLPAGSPLQQSTPPPFPCVKREEEKYPTFTEPGVTQKKPMPA